MSKERQASPQTLKAGGIILGYAEAGKKKKREILNASHTSSWSHLRGKNPKEVESLAPLTVTNCHIFLH